MSGVRYRSTKLLVLAAFILAAGASAGNAATPARGFLGAVPHTSSKAHTVSSPGALTFDASYESLINRYFTDVQAASGTDANVYSVATQYTDASGPIQYRSTFGGAYVDKDPIPASDCSDGVDPFCLTDQQLQVELQNVLNATGWHGSPTNVFFLMTPQGVGTCASSLGGSCSSNTFCAYHSDFFDLSGEAVIYADEPYEGTVGGCGGGSADQSGTGFGYPNDQEADTTINTISHEHTEAITDPFGDAWYAFSGANYEIGDLCAYFYGPELGVAANGQPYNQVINGHDYSLQEEYSNADSGCAAKLGGAPSPPSTGSGPLVYHSGQVMHTNTTYAIYWLPTPGNTHPPKLRGTAAAHKTLASSPGTWNGAATSYSYQWQRCSRTGRACVNIPGATGSTYTVTALDRTRTVRSTVSAHNVNGASRFVASAGKLVALAPAAISAPRIAGKPMVGGHLAARRGGWRWSPTAFRYQWLRCSAGGGGCVPIGRATHAEYRVSQRDSGHRLRLRVTARNAAGARTASSRPTAPVR
jgi:hypothetical protein